MNITQTSNRMHPLMAVAAVSVTVVSLLGMAAITGVLPNSHGFAAEAPRPAGLVAAAPTPVAAAPQLSVNEAIPRNPVVHHHPSYRAAPEQAHAVQVSQAEPARQYSSQPSYPQAVPVAPNSPLGIGVGAVLGGLLGSQVGGGNGKTLAAIAGAVGGGYIGNEVAKRNQ